VGSGWTNKAVRQLISRALWGGVQQEWGAETLCAYGVELPAWRKLYIRRDPYDQARYELETQAVLAKYARTGSSWYP